MRNAPVLVTLASFALLSLPVGCGSDRAKDARPESFATVCHLPTTADAMPQSLLETGCFAASGNASTALYSYQVNGVLWSDSADKTRWLLLPEGSQASVDGNGVVVLPNQAAIVKQFDRNGTRLETRFLFRDANGVDNALTYAWNDAGTDATLVGADGALRSFADGSSWEYFSRSNCMFCHNPPAGTFLGTRLPQLARQVAVHRFGAMGAANATGDANQAVAQLTQMVADGVLAGGFDAAVTPWPDPNGTAPLAARARSYLATNCSFCHMPGGYSGTQVDLRYDTPLAETGTCNVAPSFGSFGVSGASIVTPGVPTKSMLSVRLHRDQAGLKMPPVGHAVTDPAGAALIDAWIAALTSCDE